jgi:hypothetical protein
MMPTGRMTPQTLRRASRPRMTPPGMDSALVGTTLGRRDQAKIKQTPKTAATSDHQRTGKPLFYRHSRPADTTHRAPDRLCKQEVAGSRPAGSIGRSACKAAGFGGQAVLDWYSSLAESTAGEYHIGPDFVGDLSFGGLQAGGCRFDPSWSSLRKQALMTAPTLGVAGATRADPHSSTPSVDRYGKLQSVDTIRRRPPLPKGSHEHN